MLYLSAVFLYAIVCKCNMLQSPARNHFSLYDHNDQDGR